VFSKGGINLKKNNIGRTVFKIFNYIFMTAICLTCVLPFVHLLAVSFSSSSAVAAGKVNFWPVEFTAYSYKFALEGGKFLTALWVSVKRVILGVSLNMLFMVITAYPMSKTKEQLAGRNIYMIFFVATMLISGGMIPTYLVISRLGLLNSIWSLTLPYALPVYNMVILMNFIRNLPAGVEEAAMIDGASPIQILVRILLPLLKPALATVCLFCVVFHWNSWFDGMLYINETTKLPLQSYLQTLVKNFEQIMQTAGTNYVELLSRMNARTGRAAQLFIGAIPLMLIYPFLQKYFAKGLVIGSEKG